MLSIYLKGIPISRLHDGIIHEFESTTVAIYYLETLHSNKAGDLGQVTILESYEGYMKVSVVDGDGVPDGIYEIKEAVPRETSPVRIS